MKSRKLLLSLAVFFLVGVFVPTYASPVFGTEGEEENPVKEGWTSIGPNNVSGRVRSIIFDKFNDGVMYAGGVGGGLFVSVNDGLNWREIPLGEGATTGYAVTSIAQDDEGVIYVGTGEGFYAEEGNSTGVSHLKTGLAGTGVYKMQLGAQGKEWAAAFSTDEQKYEYATSLVMNRLEATAPALYDLTHEWTYVNDMLCVGNTVYAATQMGGLKYSKDGGATWSAASVGGSTMFNVTDIKVSKNGKVAIAYKNGTEARIAMRADGDEEVFNDIFSKSVISDYTENDMINRIELAFGVKNPNVMVAFVYAYKMTGEGGYTIDGSIYRTADCQAGNIVWEKASPSSFYAGYDLNTSMSIAVNDLGEREYIYAASAVLQRGFDANSSPIYYWESQTSYLVPYTSGMYVSPNIHSILFDENPQTAEDSLRIYLATDAGVFMYGTDPVTQFSQWHFRNKGLVSSQYYNVAAAADGSVVAAGQSNAISYIPTPSQDELKSAETIWSPNSDGYSNYIISNLSSTLESQTGTAVEASAIHMTSPSVRKPFVLSRPNTIVARTYSDGNDYTTVNDQTWTFSGANPLTLMHANVVSGATNAPFVTPMAYWESFDAYDTSKDSVYVVLDSTVVLRNGDKTRAYRTGVYLYDGDSVIVQSNTLGYPFFYEFTKEQYGEVDKGGEMVLDFFPTQDTSVLVVDPVQTRLYLSGAIGTFVCPEIMNFTKTYTSGMHYPEIIGWAKLCRGNDSTISLTRPFHVLAPSPDGDALLVTIDVKASQGTPGQTKLLRISGINSIDYSISQCTNGDVDRVTTDTLATFDRTISSIVFDKKDNNSVIITFSDYSANTSNVMRSTNIMAPVDDVVFEDIPLTDNNSKPVFASLIECMNPDNTSCAYIGSDDGIYKTENYKASQVVWVKEDNIPNVPIYDLYQQTANRPKIQFKTYMSNNVTENVFEATKYPGAIYAASYGKGLFMNMDNLVEGLPEVGLADVKQNAGQTSIRLYPNPADNRTTLNYTLSSSSRVTLNIFDMNGRLISTMDKGNQSAGSYTQIIDLNSLSKGVYMIQILTSNSVETAKLIVQ